jgi:hypothetical protein
MKRSRNDCRAILAAYRASSQTQKEWCQTNNINIHTLKYWIKEENRVSNIPQKSCQWQTLDMSTLKTDSHSQNQQLTIQIGPVRLEVLPGFDQQFLAEVLKTIVRAC